MPKYDTEMMITIAGEESLVDVVVMYDYSPAEKGKWLDGYQMEPDYPESVDVWEAYAENNEERLYIIQWLSQGQINGLEDEILDTYRD